MRRPDAGAGQHRDRQLRRHRQINRNPVALAHAQAFQPVGETADLPQQIAVGINLPVARLALPDDGRLIPPPVAHMTVDAVERHIQLAADEPLRVGRIPFQDGMPLLEPVQILGQPGPERLRVLGGAVINPRVAHISPRRKPRRRRKAPLLPQQCVNAPGARNPGMVNHNAPPDLNRRPDRIGN